MFHDSSLKAAPLFEQAIKLDSKLCSGLCRAVQGESWAYHSFDQYRRGGRKRVATLMRRKIAAGSSGRASCTRFLSYYYGDRDYQRALAEFEMAQARVAE